MKASSPILHIVLILVFLQISSCNSGTSGGDIFVDFSGVWHGQIVDNRDDSEVSFEARIVHSDPFFNGVFKYNNQEGRYIASNIDGNYLELLIESPLDSLNYVYTGFFRNGALNGNWYQANTLNPDERGTRLGGWTLRRPIR